MNTYYNEITAKPVNTTDSKILYKIPAGAKCGNGDLGIVFDNDETDLLLRISKCDFWKFASGARGGGGIKTVGTLRLRNIDLSVYNIKQYFDSGLLQCTFGNCTMEFFVAPENRVYFEIKAPVNGSLPAVSVEMPDTCESRNASFNKDGICCLNRQFADADLARTSAVAVCLKEIASETVDDSRVIRYCVSVVSNFDDDEYVDKATDMVLHCDYEQDKLRTCEKWQSFFAASDVCIPDKEIETYYHASLYHLACCMGNRQFPPGLFGNFITDDFFPWAGDYHMNYNYEAPYYCIFSSNHPELFEGYMTPLEEMRENAEIFAKLFNCRGYALPVSFGPKALDLYSMEGCKEHGILFLGQKSHAAYACIIPIMHWYSTYDKEYARENYYSFIYNTALFWEDYLVKEKGKYVIKNDAAHEIPYYRCEKFRYITHKSQIEAVNAINSLGLVKLLFQGVYSMAKELGLNGEKYSLWEDINENLSEFPTFIKHGKKCFRYTKKGMRWRTDNTVGLQHIYPASQIGLSSDEKLLRIARNTYFINDRRLDDNGSNSYLPAGARIGVDPSFLLDGLRMNIKEFGLPNKLFRHHGGGIEHLTTVPATVNEMLLQGHEGIIRLFPCWDKNQNASFKNLRADGAFLVSADLTDGKISSCRIQSLQGRPCTVEGETLTVIRETDSREVEIVRTGNTLTFETKAGECYILKTSCRAV